MADVNEQVAALLELRGQWLNTQREISETERHLEALREAAKAQRAKLDEGLRDLNEEFFEVFS